MKRSRSAASDIEIRRPPTPGPPTPGIVDGSLIFQYVSALNVIALRSYLMTSEAINAEIKQYIDRVESEPNCDNALIWYHHIFTPSNSNKKKYCSHVVCGSQDNNKRQKAANQVARVVNSEWVLKKPELAVRALLLLPPWTSLPWRTIEVVLIEIKYRVRGSSSILKAESNQSGEIVLSLLAEIKAFIFSLIPLSSAYLVEETKLEYIASHTCDTTVGLFHIWQDIIKIRQDTVEKSSVMQDLMNFWKEEIANLVLLSVEYLLISDSFCTEEAYKPRTEEIVPFLLNVLCAIDRNILKMKQDHEPIHHVMSFVPPAIQSLCEIIFARPMQPGELFQDISWRAVPELLALARRCSRYLLPYHWRGLFDGIMLKLVGLTSISSFDPRDVVCVVREIFFVLEHSKLHLSQFEVKWEDMVGQIFMLSSGWNRIELQVELEKEMPKTLSSLQSRTRMLLLDLFEVCLSKLVVNYAQNMSVVRAHDRLESVIHEPISDARSTLALLMWFADKNDLSFYTRGNKLKSKTLSSGMYNLDFQLDEGFCSKSEHDTKLNSKDFGLGKVYDAFSGEAYPLQGWRKKTSDVISLNQSFSGRANNKGENRIQASSFPSWRVWTDAAFAVLSREDCSLESGVQRILMAFSIILSFYVCLDEAQNIIVSKVEKTLNETLVTCQSTKSFIRNKARKHFVVLGSLASLLIHSSLYGNRVLDIFPLQEHFLNWIGIPDCLKITALKAFIASGKICRQIISSATQHEKQGYFQTSGRIQLNKTSKEEMKFLVVLAFAYQIPGSETSFSHCIDYRAASIEAICLLIQDTDTVLSYTDKYWLMSLLQDMHERGNMDLQQSHKLLRACLLRLSELLASKPVTNATSLLGLYITFVPERCFMSHILTDAYKQRLQAISFSSDETLSLFVLALKLSQSILESKDEHGKLAYCISDVILQTRNENVKVMEYMKDKKCAELSFMMIFLSSVIRFVQDDGPKGLFIDVADYQVASSYFIPETEGKSVVIWNDAKIDEEEMKQLKHGFVQILRCFIISRLHQETGLSDKQKEFLFTTLRTLYSTCMPVKTLVDTNMILQNRNEPKSKTVDSLKICWGLLLEIDSFMSYSPFGYCACMRCSELSIFDLGCSKEAESTQTKLRADMRFCARHDITKIISALSFAITERVDHSRSVTDVSYPLQLIICYFFNLMVKTEKILKHSLISQEPRVIEKNDLWVKSQGLNRCCQNWLVYLPISSHLQQYHSFANKCDALNTDVELIRLYFSCLRCIIKVVRSEKAMFGKDESFARRFLTAFLKRITIIFICLGDDKEASKTPQTTSNVRKKSNASEYPLLKAAMSLTSNVLTCAVKMVPLLRTFNKLQEVEHVVSSQEQFKVSGAIYKMETLCHHMPQSFFTYFLSSGELPALIKRTLLFKSYFAGLFDGAEEENLEKLQYSLFHTLLSMLYFLLEQERDFHALCSRFSSQINEKIRICLCLLQLNLSLKKIEDTPLFQLTSEGIDRRRIQNVKSGALLNVLNPKFCKSFVSKKWATFELVSCKLEFQSITPIFYAYHLEEYNRLIRKYLHELDYTEEFLNYTKVLEETPEEIEITDTVESILKVQEIKSCYTNCATHFTNGLRDSNIICAAPQIRGKSSNIAKRSNKGGNYYEQTSGFVPKRVRKRLLDSKVIRSNAVVLEWYRADLDIVDEGSIQRDTFADLADFIVPG